MLAVGVTVTVCVVVTGPLHPAALAVITVVPLQVDEYVTAPVVGTIVLPPDMLAASRV
jgi:fructose-specific phosphotransferase system IIC component